MARKQPSTVEPATESLSDLAQSIFTESLTAIRDEIRGIIAHRIKPKGHDPASRVAWLAKQAASVSAEQRKAEKGELDALKRLTAAQVILWVRQQPVEARARIARDIAALDSKERKSVLG